MDYRRYLSESRVACGPIGALVLLALVAGCSRLAERPAGPVAVFKEVEARRAGFEGFQARAVLTLEHKADKLTIPLDISVTDQLRIEVRGEVSHFLLPFEGEVRLVSDEGATILDTNIGTYDLAVDPEAQAGVRAFLLSLGGGGDWLVWWLTGQGCDPAPKTACMGLEIELEQDSRLRSISRWEVREPSAGASFRGEVEEYQQDRLAPVVIRGVIQPQEIAVYLKYRDISTMPDRAD